MRMYLDGADSRRRGEGQVEVLLVDAQITRLIRTQIFGHPPKNWFDNFFTSIHLILDSIVVSIPACHAGGRGSIPRRGGNFLFSPNVR